MESCNCVESPWSVDRLLVKYRVKTGESFLKHKTEKLDGEMGLITKQEETSRHVLMLHTGPDHYLSLLSIDGDKHLGLAAPLVQSHGSLSYFCMRIGMCLTPICAIDDLSLLEPCCYIFLNLVIYFKFWLCSWSMIEASTTCYMSWFKCSDVPSVGIRAFVQCQMVVLLYEDEEIRMLHVILFLNEGISNSPLGVFPPASPVFFFLAFCRPSHGTFATIVAMRMLPYLPCLCAATVYLLLVYISPPNFYCPGVPSVLCVSIFFNMLMLAPMYYEAWVKFVVLGMITIGIYAFYCQYHVDLSSITSAFYLYRFRRLVDVKTRGCTGLALDLLCLALKEGALMLGPYQISRLQCVVIKNAHLQSPHVLHKLQGNHHLEDKVVLKVSGDDTIMPNHKFTTKPKRRPTQAQYFIALTKHVIA